VSADALSPDTGESLRLWLRSEAEVTAMVGGAATPRIGITLTGSDPAIRLAQVGRGSNLGGGAVSARWQVECWGKASTPDDGTTGQLARKVMRLAPEFVGVWGGATISGAAADPPYSQPDPTTGRPRHIVEVSFIAAP
jgi:hypothetical protein